MKNFVSFYLLSGKAVAPIRDY